ncbi:MAG: glycosyltransferase [Geminicoccaceae bacterium]
METSPIIFAYPGDLDTRTGGYIYDKRLLDEFGAQGMTVGRLALGDGFPQPSAEIMQVAVAKLRALAPGTRVIIDGLAYGAMGGEAEALAARLRLFALVHHPLAFETGIPPAEAETLRLSETRALACAHRVITTSSTTARTLVEHFAVEPDRIVVAPPGTDEKPVARGSSDRRVHLLAVAGVVPRKDLATLARALGGLYDLPWHLNIAGSLERSPSAVRELRAAISEGGIGERVTLLGEVDEAGLDRLYSEADLFVSSSLYEGYGMALIEAVAWGLPVVAARGGAVADILPSDAAFLVAPGDPSSMAAALRRVIENDALRHRLRAGAIEARARLPRWPDTAGLIRDALESARS